MIVAVAMLSLMPQGSEWHYVSPDAGAPQAHAPLRALPLFSSAPKDVTEDAAYRGTQRRYAQVRFGAPGTTRIAVVVDRLDDGKVDLYVDADRNRQISASDRVSGRGPAWRLPLQIARSDGTKATYEPRHAMLRLDEHSLAFAPVGYLEGRAKLGDQTLLVRRVDADGNDSFSDRRDRILIDRNGDGKFDPFDEVFLYAPVLMIGDQRWVVREREDLGVEFAELSGTGSVRLIVGEALAKTIRLFTLTLQSKDGMTIGIHEIGKKREIPVGVYRAVNLDLTLDDPHGGQPWGFVFSSEGAAKRWFEVKPDGAIDVAPLDGLALEVGAKSKVAIAGDYIHLQPRLTTPDGLLINSCWRGQHTGFSYGGPSANISLRAEGGDQLDSATSGFA